MEIYGLFTINLELFVSLKHFICATIVIFHKQFRLLNVF